MAEQVWEIGYPDRAADEFFKGDGSNYWLWGWNLRYALLFPGGLTYTVGKSDPRKDWFFEEVPTATNLSFLNPDAKDPANQRFGWVKAESLTEYPQTNQTGPWHVYGRGKETVWTIKFNMPKAEHGTAALRVGLAGVDGLRGGLAVAVNGKSAGAVGDGSNPDNQRLIQTQRDPLQHRQRTMATAHAEVRRRAAEGRREHTDVHRAGGRSAERCRVGLPAAGTRRECQTRSGRAKDGGIGLRRSRRREGNDTVGATTVSTGPDEQL